MDECDDVDDNDEENIDDDETEEVDEGDDNVGDSECDDDFIMVAVAVVMGTSFEDFFAVTTASVEMDMVTDLIAGVEFVNDVFELSQSCSCSDFIECFMAIVFDDLAFLSEEFRPCTF